MKKLFLICAMIAGVNAWAWGRRGHQIVAETSAQLIGNDAAAKFLRAHSFDMGYYANVPDFFWKRPETYEIEKPNHFMDMEIFDRVLAKRPEVKKPFELDRLEFEKTFPEIPASAGRAFWRIRELSDSLETFSQSLRALEGDTSPEATDQRRRIQEKWILTAGVVAHYIGDLGMPLHVSENYDGKMTGQPGIHSYFEDASVDELYPTLATEVYNEAKKQWPAFTKKNAAVTILAMVQEVASDSAKSVPTLLKIDRQVGRKDQAKSAHAFHDLIVKRMVQSSLVLAELYRRNVTGWNFDDNKFFYFGGEPPFIPPPHPEGAATPAKK
jgi:hypothetical protein